MAEKIKLERVKASLSRTSGGMCRRKPTDPDFESVFDDGDDNLFAGVEMTGDLQEDADATMSEALRQIIERKKATQERFRIATDPEFFLCVCFQSREQKEDFLQKAGWEGLGYKYINGLEVARRMNVDVQAVEIAPLKLRGKIKKFRPDDILGSKNPLKGGEE
jgi:hypothetical protein